MGSHSVNCYPTEVRIPPLPPAEAGTRFSDPGGMQGWVDPVFMLGTRMSFELNYIVLKAPLDSNQPTLSWNDQEAVWELTHVGPKNH